MMKSDRTHQEGFDAPRENCPDCGTRIQSFTRRGPSDVVVVPCGCNVGDQLTVQDAAGELVADGMGLDRWHDLTGFQRDIIHAIAAIQTTNAESYGLAIKADLEARYGQEVNHGRLYQNLNSLVDKDLIEKTPLDNRTNEYTLTPAAEGLFDAAARSHASAASIDTQHDHDDPTALQEADD